MGVDDFIGPAMSTELHLPRTFCFLYIPQFSVSQFILLVLAEIFFDPEDGGDMFL
jgi:hypothetical protein